MTNQGRVLTPHNIKSISTEINNKRNSLTIRFDDAVKATVEFASAVNNAIGEISVAEAEQGIIDFFTEQMRKRT